LRGGFNAKAAKNAKNAKEYKFLSFFAVFAFFAIFAFTQLPVFAGMMIRATSPRRRPG
jgi:hypothetical protein